MGRDKAMLTLPNGLTLLDHAIRTLRLAGADEILVSVRQGQAYGRSGTREVADATNNCGPLSGLAAALDAAKTDHLAVLAIDLPAMTEAYLRKLVAHCTTTSGAIPSQGDFFEPLAGIYPRLAATSAHAALTAGKFSLQAWLRELVNNGLIKPVIVEPTETGLFANWNRPEDFPGGYSP